MPRRASHYRPDGRARTGREPVCCACGGGYPRKEAKPRREAGPKPKPKPEAKPKAKENQAVPKFRPAPAEGDRAGPEAGYSRGSAAWARQQQREHMERSRLRAEAAARFAARGGG